jgi:L-lactate dehydrogenase complex protein LldF
LREAASRIKDETLGHLGDFLVEFSRRASANGVHVHWASDSSEHNRIVRSLLEESGARTVVKSKSMLTEECGLNPYLERHGFDVIDTDLGERIVQLAGQPPSHIVMPAIHMRREEIGELFARRMGTEAGESRPEALTAAARVDLRRRFLLADAAITGVNFGVARTGGIVVCTNEGNADLGMHLAPLHIASMGIEKVIPGLEELAVFLRLLARSATGQALTVYTSHITAPRPGANLHVILVDNGRTDLLGTTAGREALKCIRCGACMNTCPVFRRAGGHEYETVIPGPIGSVLAPALDPQHHGHLPFASTLCGSCSDVCPVRIDLHGLLFDLRQEVTREIGPAPAVFRLASYVLTRPALYRWAGRLGRWALRHGRIVGTAFRPWTASRDLPVPPKEPFRDWFAENREG